MKKVVLGLLAVVLSLAMIVPGASPAMAQTETESELVSKMRLALVVRAPRVAEVGKPVTIKVNEWHSHKPVAEADVYAVKVEDAKKALITVDKTDYNALMGQYTTIAKENGAYIGKTNNGGVLTHKFEEQGRYLLVAFKDGYRPGFTRIGITLSMVRALAIRAPRITEVGRQVPIKVGDRYTYKPVAGAKVYAVKMSEASKVSVAIIKADPTDNTGAEKYTALVKDRGVYIGETDKEGKLVHKFEEAGRYVLVAFKDGYRPGFTRIGVRPATVRGLAIRAPKMAEVGKPVTIKVVERHVGKPVAEAEVYAVKVEKANEVIVESADTVELSKAEAYATLVKNRGAYIGKTDSEGKLVHRFGESGKYTLVAMKKGYRPGFARIDVKPPRNLEASS